VTRKRIYGIRFIIDVSFLIRLKDANVEYLEEGVRRRIGRQ
jgi:hypothetical protein